MSISGLLYGKAMLSLANAEIDLDTHAIKAMLTTSSYVPNQDTDQYKSSVTNEVSATGYSAGGATLGSPTVTYTGGTNVFMFDAADVSWTITGSLTARVAVIYDGNAGTDATRPLIGYQLSSADIVATDGTFQIVWSASGILTITVA